MLDGEDEDIKEGDVFANLNRLSPIPLRISTLENAYRPLLAKGEEEARKRLLLGELAILVGHTTRAARLLLWPLVATFLAKQLKLQNNTLEVFVEYPNI